MPKQTVFNKLEMDEHGNIFIRYQKQFVDEDGSVIDLGWHRSSPQPGEDLDTHIAMVSENLTRDVKAGAVVETPGLAALKRVVSAARGR
jgi:hypothetical protein